MQRALKKLTGDGVSHGNFAGARQPRVGGGGLSKQLSFPSAGIIDSSALSPGGSNSAGSYIPSPCGGRGGHRKDPPHGP